MDGWVGVLPPFEKDGADARESPIQVPVHEYAVPLTGIIGRGVLSTEVPAPGWSLGPGPSKSCSQSGSVLALVAKPRATAPFWSRACRLDRLNVPGVTPLER